MATTEEFSIRQLCEATWIIHKQIGKLLEAIENNKPRFRGGDRIFLDSIEVLLKACYHAVQIPLNICIKKTKLKKCLVHPFGGDGCICDTE